MRYVELYSGAGGSSCGLVSAGWECVGAVDLDVTALATYALNFPSHPTHRIDLAHPLPDTLRDEWKAALDQGALVGSSPCTDFSTANPAPRDRSTLTAAFARDVSALRPKIVVFENVPRARTSTAYHQLCETLQQEGYTFADGVVSVLGAGVAQTRKRLVLIASRECKHVARVAWDNLSAALSVPHRTMRECFDDSGISYAQPFIYIPSCDERHRKSIFALDQPAPTIRCYLRPFRTSYPFTARDATHDARRVFAAEPVHIAALQGFPADFVWTGSKTARCKCIGNAVPPPLARLIGLAIQDAIVTCSSVHTEHESFAS